LENLDIDTKFLASINNLTLFIEGLPFVGKSTAIKNFLENINRTAIQYQEVDKLSELEQFKKMKFHE
jgi:AAA+ ATPase superfamily predicted ATPase